MKFLSLIFLYFFTLLLNAQKPVYFVKIGDEAAAKELWNEAFAYYSEAYQMDTSDFAISTKLADAARQVKEYDLALNLYAKNYEKDNGKLNPDELYWLAMMQKYHARYEDAQRNFKKYIKKHKKSGTQSLVKRAEQEMKSAIWALNYKNNADVAKPEKLNERINSDESDIAPFLTSNKFYFSSSRLIDNKTDWKILQMDSLNANGVSVLRIDGLENTYACANLFVGEKWILFSVKNEGKTKIFTADKLDDSLLNPRAMDALNSEGTINTMPFFVASGEDNRIYFVSDRSGGEGGLDIWYSQIDNGEWIVPINAGKIINSPGDEVSPFVENDQLFFSSDWHEGLGGLDIFSSVIFTSSFDKPINAGKPFNSELNDLYYSVCPDASQVLFASNRKTDSNSQKSTCCNDIYVVRKQPAVNEELITKNMFESLEALQRVLPVVLYFHNDEPNPRSLDTTTTLSYLQSYESYLNLIPTYLKENSFGLFGDQKDEAESITNDFFDLQVKKGYDDLRFFSELLLLELEKGNSVQISVRGFASPRAKSDYNLNLTKRRTASLVNYLMHVNGGAFKSYLEFNTANGAQLTVDQLPFGEYKSAMGVSDDLDDQKKSIYSRAASFERKIEIESIIILDKKVEMLPIEWQESEFDFGKIGKYEKVYHSFVYTNTTNREIRIDSAIASCGCTEPKLKKTILLPGESSEMEVGFDPFGKKGHDVKTVTIFIEGEQPKVIKIIADVEL